MAVDTRDKRFSLIGFGSPTPWNLPNPDGSVDTQDRAMLLHLYHGLDITVTGVTGTGSGDLGAITADADGKFTNNGTAAGDLAAITGDADGAVSVTGTATGTLPAILGDADGIGGTVIAVTTAGSSKGKGQPKRRRVILDGQSYWVDSNIEEQKLLHDYLLERQKQHDAALAEQDSETLKAARIAMARARNRLARVRERMRLEQSADEAELVERLKQQRKQQLEEEDDLLLLLLVT